MPDLSFGCFPLTEMTKIMLQALNRAAAAWALAWVPGMQVGHCNRGGSCFPSALAARAQRPVRRPTIRIQRAALSDAAVVKKQVEDPRDGAGEQLRAPSLRAPIPVGDYPTSKGSACGSWGCSSLAAPLKRVPHCLTTTAIELQRVTASDGGGGQAGAGRRVPACRRPRPAARVAHPSASR